MSELPVRVGSETDQACTCQEVGEDGTGRHGSVVGVARVEFPNLIVTAVFCENHRKNYAHWSCQPSPAVERPAPAKETK